MSYFANVDLVKKMITNIHILKINKYVYVIIFFNTEIIVQLDYYEHNL